MLTNKNIKLRAVEPEDLELFYVWENDTEIWNVGNTLNPISKYILKKYIENSHQDIFEAKQLRLMIDLPAKNKTIGTIDLFDFDHYHSHVGLGILIADKDERNKGFAKEAIQLIIEYCFKKLSIHTLFCNISEDNTPSLKLFENTGFKRVGTKKEWLYTPHKRLDEYFYQLINK